MLPTFVNSASGSAAVVLDALRGDARFAPRVVAPGPLADALRAAVARGPGRIVVAGDECVVHLRRAWVTVAIDGELLRLRPPLRYRLRRDAFTVIVPPETWSSTSSAARFTMTPR